MNGVPPHPPNHPAAPASPRPGASRRTLYLWQLQAAPQSVSPAAPGSIASIISGGLGQHRIWRGWLTQALLGGGKEGLPPAREVVVWQDHLTNLPPDWRALISECWPPALSARPPSMGRKMCEGAVDQTDFPDPSKTACDQGGFMSCPFLTVNFMECGAAADGAGQAWSDSNTVRFRISGEQNQSLAGPALITTAQWQSSAA